MKIIASIKTDISNTLLSGADSKDTLYKADRYHNIQIEPKL
jgi:hypothetical protein